MAVIGVPYAVLRRSRDEDMTPAASGDVGGVASLPGLLLEGRQDRDRGDHSREKPVPVQAAGRRARRSRSREAAAIDGASRAALETREAR